MPKQTSKLTMVQALNLALREEMAQDDAVVLLGEDIGKNGGVFRVTEGLQERFGEERVVDTPLAESGIVGTSIGMALSGLKPVAEMQFSGFAFVMFGQLEGHAGRFRGRSLGQWTVPMVVRMPYGGGVRALEHHSESPEASYAHFAGLKVVVPSSPRNARALLVAAIRDPDPVVFLEPKRSYRAFREEVPDELAPRDELRIGQAQVVEPGEDLTIISWGAMMRPTIKAVDELKADRAVSVEVVDLLTLSPMDAETIAASVRKTGRCVVVQESKRSFGVASEVIAHINDRALMYLEAPVRRVTGFDTTTPYFAREMGFIPSVGRIRRAIEETLDF